MNANLQNEYSQNGTLVVAVSTASGAIPIEGAVVTVYGSDELNSGVRTVIYTNRSGNTEKITLPAPPASLSENPGSISPFAKYNVDVNKEGYNLRTFVNVPIFAGITSIQPVNLIPLTEYGGEAILPNDSTVTESQSPDL